tara:strand:+ start:97 stop:300 length:204 start_codon:yes stop_codon:yes gene_type:complete
MSISTYILLGVAYMFFIELLADWLAKSLKRPNLASDLTIYHRLFGIIVWPIGLVIFLYNFIKAKYRL